MKHDRRPLGETVGHFGRLLAPVDPGVLDRIVEREGTSRTELGRERYLARMQRFMDETRNTILAQFRRLGASADWSRTRFTMDEMSSRAVRWAIAAIFSAQLGICAMAAPGSNDCALGTTTCSSPTSRCRAWTA